MVSTETIALLTGIIMCVIGVSSFVLSLTSKAKSEGILAQKVDSALRGIEEIKKSLKEQHTWREGVGVAIERHSQQIDTLFRKIKHIENIMEINYKDQKNQGEN